MKCVKETYNQLFWQVTTRWLQRNVILSLGLWRPQLRLTVAGCDYFYHSEMYIRIQHSEIPMQSMLQCFTFLFRWSENEGFFFSNEKCYKFNVFTYASLLLGQDMASSKPFHFLPKLAQIQQLNHDWKWPFFALTRNPWLKLTYVNEFLNLLLIQNLTDVQAVGAFSGVLELEILILLVRLSFRLLHTSPTTERRV